MAHLPVPPGAWPGWRRGIKDEERQAGARKDEEIQVEMMQALFNRMLWEGDQTSRSIWIGMKNKNQRARKEK